jgi:hypothetical protein
MFSILNKAKPDIENIRDLNLAVVKHMAVQVIKLVLQPKLPLIGHNLLYRAWTKRGFYCKGKRVQTPGKRIEDRRTLLDCQPNFSILHKQDKTV